MASRGAKSIGRGILLFIPKQPKGTERKPKAMDNFRRSKMATMYITTCSHICLYVATTILHAMMLFIYNRDGSSLSN